MAVVQIGQMQMPVKQSIVGVVMGVRFLRFILSGGVVVVMMQIVVSVAMDVTHR